MGFRNFIVGDFRGIEYRSDKGVVYENFVLNELKASLDDAEIKYWRTKDKKEVDFIVEISREIVLVEVKAKPELSRGVLEFMEKYKPKRVLVVNEESFEVEKRGKTVILYVPFVYL